MTHTTLRERLHSFGDSFKELQYKTLAKQAIAVGSLVAACNSFADLSTPKWLDNAKNDASGKNFETMADGINSAVSVGGELFFNIITLLGFMVMGYSIYYIYSASKDEHKKSTPGWIGLVAGSAMSGVGVIAFMIRNQIIGSTT